MAEKLLDMKKASLLTFFFIATNLLLAQYSLNKSLISSAVLLEYVNGDSVGFSSGLLIRDSLGGVYLVTARHFLFKTPSPKGKVASVPLLSANKLRVSYLGNQNYEEENAFEINIKKLFDAGLIKYSTEYDVALMKIASTSNSGVVKLYDTAEFKQVKGSGENSITLTEINDLGLYKDVNVSDDAFVIGYPKVLGLKEYPQYDYNKPLLRKGVIAGKYLKKQTIIVDCPSYGGNSGGPVIEIFPKSESSKIIGIVVEFIPYDTNGIRTNSGYLVAIPIEKALDLIKEFKVK